MQGDFTPTAALQAIACVLFVFGLKLMGKRESAKLGNTISAAGMIIAVLAAVFTTGISWPVVLAAGIAGSAAGAVLATRVKMTGMPELVAIFNGLGGLASMAIGMIELLRPEVASDALEQTTAIAPSATAAIAAAAVIVGGVAFTGSLIAYAKLGGLLSQKPVVFPGQLVLSAVSVLVAIGVVIWAVVAPDGIASGIALAALSLVIGVLAVIRIGGGDMPVVVSLLNSYSGVAAAFAGLAIGSPVLVVAGTLVGAAGLMLTRVMCKAMNRSLGNVLFAGFGAEVVQAKAPGEQGTAHPITAADSYFLLEAARDVIIVPGYGMAVARAQHVVEELTGLLKTNGTRVRFVIHPVAGRMPGHMNVLLAEAGVPYEHLVEPQDVNPAMQDVDVALVIGANDIVNPDAKEDASSPLFGMPIVEVDRARNVIVLKRSMNTGFAGVQNSLFFRQNTRMLFGDARESIAAVNAEFED
ncbi:MAG: NAD(P)(+) transhydrogenase (Re/Si-specific) subunit beta [Planctomycetota bacterium]